MTLFDILNSISHIKNDLSNEPDFDKVYNTFMINRYLSMDADVLMYVQYMNRFPNIPKIHQYRFYLEAIPPKRRFFKYTKAELEDCKNIMEYFDVGYDEGQQIKSLLQPKEINIINKLYKD